MYPDCSYKIEHWSHNTGSCCPPARAPRQVTGILDTSRKGKQSLSLFEDNFTQGWIDQHCYSVISWSFLHPPHITQQTFKLSSSSVPSILLNSWSKSLQLPSGTRDHMAQQIVTVEMTPVRTVATQCVSSSRHYSKPSMYSNSLHLKTVHCRFLHPPHYTDEKTEAHSVWINFSG